MGQILAIVSSKGGVGKTTTAVNLAAAFASLDFPTLLVEADPQCGIVANFGFDRFDIPRGLAEVARREARAEEVTFETSVDGLHVVSSNVWSQQEEAEYLKALETDPLVFREQLAAVAEAYDYVVIDAPPMLGPITVAILAAAHRFIVPLQTEPQALRSLGRLVETAGQVRERMNPGLVFDGIALTMVDSRTRLSLQVIEQVQADYPDLAFTNSIPRSVRLSEMAAAGRPLVVAAPTSRGARAYAALAEEILLKHARERMMERAGDDDEDALQEAPAAGGGGWDADGDNEPLAMAPRAEAADNTPAGEPLGDSQTLTALLAPEEGSPADALSPEADGSPGTTALPGAAPGDADNAAVDNNAAHRPVGRIAIASGRIPEQGGDIHKSSRRQRVNGSGTVPHAAHVVARPAEAGANGGHHSGVDAPAQPADRVSRIRLVAPGVSGGGAPVADGAAQPRANGTHERNGAATTRPGEDAADEWNEAEFVDLDTYMEMESGEAAGAGAVATEDEEWDEEWGE